jgi:hypothetical protein
MHKNLRWNALDCNATSANLARPLSSDDKGKRNQQPEPAARAPR